MYISSSRASKVALTAVLGLTSGLLFLVRSAALVRCGEGRTPAGGTGALGTDSGPYANMALCSASAENFELKLFLQTCPKISTSSRLQRGEDKPQQRRYDWLRVV